MSDLIESSLDKKTAELLAQRVNEPDANALAEKIIFTSKNLPQELKSSAAKSVWSNRFEQSVLPRLFSVKALMSASLMSCFILAVLPAAWYIQQTETIDFKPVAQSTSIDVDSLSEEFSWDNLLIMEDELAFSEL